MAKKFSMTNKLEKKQFPDKKDGFKGEWQRTKFTMTVNDMPTPKLQYNEKLNKITLGYPKDK